MIKLHAHSYVMDRIVPHSPLEGKTCVNMDEAVEYVLSDSSVTPNPNSHWSESEFRAGY